MKNINRKSFRTKIRATKSFRMYIQDFAFAVTFLFRMREKIRLTFIPSFMVKPSLTINSRRIRLLLSSRLITRMTQTISSRRIRLNFSMKEIQKAATTISAKHPMVFFIRSRQRIMTTINNGKLRVLVSPTIAQFFNLGTYDPQTLGTLDTKTLAQMDYVIS